MNGRGLHRIVARGFCLFGFCWGFFLGGGGGGGGGNLPSVLLQKVVYFRPKHSYARIIVIYSPIHFRTIFLTMRMSSL